MSKSTKLADLIADLDSTAPKDYDPEDVLEPMNDRAEQSDSDDNAPDQGVESAAREHYVSVGKSKLRSNQPLLDDPRYAGKRTSRKDLFEDDEKDVVASEEDSNSSGEDNSSDEDNVEGNGNDSFDDEEDLMAKAHTYKDDFNPDASPESESEDSDREVNEEDEEVLDSDDDEEDKDNDKSDAFSSDDEMKEQDSAEEEDDVSNELRRIQEEEKQMISQLSKSAQEDVEKGKHVRQQLTLWDNCLESRIRMQKVVDDANRLPQIDAYGEILAKSEGVEKDLEVAKNELREVIDDLMDMRTGLFAQHGSVDLSAKELNSRKRHLDDDDEYLDNLWKDISEMNDVFVPFRNSTLEKWSNKVQAASGARLNKKFKAFDQNIMSQIENAMADREGLIKRTQLQRSDYKIIGKATAAAAANSESKADGSDVPVDEGKKPDRHLNNHDVEIFDDHDFYQQQLRELIESRMVDTDDPLAIGMRWAARKQTEQKKKKRDVNRKASKGRQLRFNVHEKLQNFMAPIPAGEWHESMIDELYSSLLGQKIGL